MSNLTVCCHNTLFRYCLSRDWMEKIKLEQAAKVHVALKYADALSFFCFVFGEGGVQEF